MEMQRCCYGAADCEAVRYPAVESQMMEAAILAHKSFVFTYLLVGSLANNDIVFLDSVRTDQRFSASELNKVKQPDAENNDAGEAEVGNGKEDEDSVVNDGDAGDDSDEDTDDSQEDSDDEVDSEESEDESDDDDEDDSNSDDDDDDDEDEDDCDDEDESDSEDEDEQFKLPSQRKK